MWLAGRDDVGGDWSQAGSVLRIRCGSVWLACTWAECGQASRTIAADSTTTPRVPDGSFAAQATHPSASQCSHSLATTLTLCSAGGPWFAAIPEELWPDVDVSANCLPLLRLVHCFALLARSRMLPRKAMHAAAALACPHLQPVPLKGDKFTFRCDCPAARQGASRLPS